jgi:hypothetical protein
MPDLSDQIETAAQQPKSATTDAGTVSQHPLADIIAADEYLKANAAAESPKRGFSLARFKPPGTV